MQVVVIHSYMKNFIVWSVNVKYFRLKITHFNCRIHSRCASCSNHWCWKSLIITFVETYLILCLLDSSGGQCIIFQNAPSHILMWFGQVQTALCSASNSVSWNVMNGKYWPHVNHKVDCMICWPFPIMSTSVLQSALSLLISTVIFQLFLFPERVLNACAFISRHTLHVCTLGQESMEDSSSRTWEYQESQNW